MTIKGKTWHINGSGIKDVGWTQIDGSWYYFNDDGELVTGTETDGQYNGWKDIDSNRYYLMEDGKMLEGWHCIGGNWYFLSRAGLRTGWLRSDGSWYYLDDNGVMVADATRKIDGKVYEFAKNGVCKNP